MMMNMMMIMIIILRLLQRSLKKVNSYSHHVFGCVGKKKIRKFQFELNLMEKSTFTVTAKLAFALSILKREYNYFHIL